MPVLRQNSGEIVWGVPALYIGGDFKPLAKAALPIEAGRSAIGGELGEVSIASSATCSGKAESAHHAGNRSKSGKK